MTAREGIAGLRPAKGGRTRVAADSPIPNCVPCLEGNEKAYVTEAIDGGWLAVGPFIGRFERAIATVTGAKHAIALANGTTALHLALLIAGVKPNDLVLMPTLTFAATANAVMHCGADPEFFDSAPDSWALDANAVRRFIEQDCVASAGRLIAKRSGRRIGAILPVHLYGHPADMDPLVALAEEYGLPLVEDGAEALGSLYKERPVGSLHRLCVLSFNGNKVITGGAGGMILTEDDGLAQRARYLSAQARDDATEFVHGAVGYNYRLPNLNAAVALAQAEQLPEFLRRKRRHVDRYQDALARLDGLAMWQEASWAMSSYWMAILTVDEERHPGAVEGLRRHLPAHGIEARPVWTPLHRQAPYGGDSGARFPVAERLNRTGLCLPCSVGLTDAEHDRVVGAIRGYFETAL